MRSTKEIVAQYDDTSISVYQAFSTEIAEFAVAQGRFGRGFNWARMTWIKPSFGWMMYRSQYASLPGQERVLRIKISHDGFLTALDRAVPATWGAARFPARDEWCDALARSEVRYQWDPDRDFTLGRLDRRALQIGLRGEMVKHYVSDWTLEIEDITPLAHLLKTAVDGEPGIAERLPHERRYPVPAGIRRNLGMEETPPDD